VFPVNVPNILTVVRILLVPVLVVALLEETAHGDTIAAIVFAIAAFTDGLDGYIARSRKAITTFGKVMDPIADKLLITAALIALVSLNRVAAWVAMVIIAREFAVSSLRVAAAQQGAIIPASVLGKIKTVTQVAAVMALIAAGDSNAVWVQALVYAAVAVTVASGVDYFLNVRREIEEAREALAAQREARSASAETSRTSNSSRDVPRM
jgi:CDP-diacylglycerol--glycerol-3-phosphate 3-phosphatidyltransferase